MDNIQLVRKKIIEAANCAAANGAVGYIFITITAQGLHLHTNCNQNEIIKYALQSSGIANPNAIARPKTVGGEVRAGAKLHEARNQEGEE